MTDYSDIKSYFEKDNDYFIFPQNSEKPVKTIIWHLLPYMTAEDISNSFET
jgi:hypothetical protein